MPLTSILLDWCRRHCPGKGQCRVTRANRYHQTSSGWRSWWPRSPPPGPLTSWRSLQRLGSAALDVSSWWDLGYSHLHRQVLHNLHVQALEGMLCCLTWSSAGRRSFLTSPLPQFAGLKFTLAAVVAFRETASPLSNLWPWKIDGFIRSPSRKFFNPTNVKTHCNISQHWHFGKPLTRLPTMHCNPYFNGFWTWNNRVSNLSAVKLENINLKSENGECTKQPTLTHTWKIMQL